MIEDHDGSSIEIDGLIQIVIEANKEDTLYVNGKYIKIFY